MESEHPGVEFNILLFTDQSETNSLCKYNYLKIKKMITLNTSTVSKYDYIERTSTEEIS